jgi:aspartate/methionine/tyrosine aminotransferase
MANKNILMDGLKTVGFKVYDSLGTYFVVVDQTSFGFDNDISFFEHLIENIGIVSISKNVFYMDPNEGKQNGKIYLFQI